MPRPDRADDADKLASTGARAGLAVGRRGRDHALARLVADDAAMQMLALYLELANRRP